MPEFKNASVIMGAVTETQSLRTTVDTILEICDHRDLCEIIIAYSQNATPECVAVCRELENRNDDVPIIVFEQHRKKLAGVIDMMDIARGSHCVAVSSDMAMDLSCVPEMIKLAKVNGNVLIKSSRWMKGCRFFGYGRVKKVVNYCAQRFLSLLFFVRMTDMTTPNQLVPTVLYQSVNWENEGYSLLEEMVLKPIRLGCSYKEVPTNYYARNEGESGNSIRETAKYLVTALHIRFMKKGDILKPGSKSELQGIINNQNKEFYS